MYYITLATHQQYN